MAESVTAMEKSSTGMDANLAAVLSYVFGIVSGLIFFLVEKQSRLVKFHAMQAILFSGALFIASIVTRVIPVLGAILGLLLGLAGVVIWIVLMIKAYHGEFYKLPVLGDIAERNAAVPTI